MGESAYHSLVSEFLWIGITPKHALKLAALRYPDEERRFRSKRDLARFAEQVMDMCFYKYEEHKSGNFEEIRKSSNYTRVIIYLDGANLLRSYAFINDEIKLVSGVIERNISSKISNYQQPFFDCNYPLWYLSTILIEATGIFKALVNQIHFVMGADNQQVKKYLLTLKKNYGFNVIMPPKTGKGLKSSSGEDKVLKVLILDDLNQDRFDVAIIGTGDGNKKDGISFPEIGRHIQARKKKVIFAGIDLSTSKKIKDHFDYIDVALWVLVPAIGRAEINSNEPR